MRDPLLLLEDIRDACARIMRHVEGLSFEGFCADEKTLNAVLYNLVVIGEAVKKLPDSVRDRHGSVEWRKIAGMRDIVVHEYFGIVPEIVWDVACCKVPELLEQVRAILDIETARRERPDGPR